MFTFTSLLNAGFSQERLKRREDRQVIRFYVLLLLTLNSPPQDKVTFYTFYPSIQDSPFSVKNIFKFRNFLLLQLTSKSTKTIQGFSYTKN